MKFETLAEGHVTLRKPTDATPVAAGPRCVVADNGDLVCVYMVQSKLGINDFVATLARSTDGGSSWREIGPVWPTLLGKSSCFVNLGRSRSGELFLFGSRSKIDAPGESNWNDATLGLKQTEMVWASSSDHGQTWTLPNTIPQQIPGAHEAPGPLVITKSGSWVGPFSPYNTFDPNLKVDREQVVVLISSDKGKTWTHRSMLRFDEKTSGGAEAWCVELSDGRLLGTAWHVNHIVGDKTEYPNKFALSSDGGLTWSKTHSTGIMGHTTALAALPDGRGLFLNVRRRPASDLGVWLAVVKPSINDFGVQHNERVWQAGSATQHGGSAGHDNWTDFNFGEPCVTVMRDGTLLVTLWYLGKVDSGIRYVKLRMVE